MATSPTSASTATIPGAEAFTGPVRHRSHLDTRPPGSTSNNSSSSSRCALVGTSARVVNSRWVACSRTRATSRVNVVIPGNSTSFSRIQRTA